MKVSEITSDFTGHSLGNNILSNKHRIQPLDLQFLVVLDTFGTPQGFYHNSRQVCVNIEGCSMPKQEIEARILEHEKHYLKADAKFTWIEVSKEQFEKSLAKPDIYSPHSLIDITLHPEKFKQITE